MIKSWIFLKDAPLKGPQKLYELSIVKLKKLPKIFIMLIITGHCSIIQVVHFEYGKTY
jgi:hypothetical protein